MDEVAFREIRRIQAKRAAGETVTASEEDWLNFVEARGCGAMSYNLEMTIRTSTPRPVDPAAHLPAVGAPRGMAGALESGVEEVINLTGSKSAAQGRIIDEMTRLGDRARAVLHYERVGQPGHMVNVENINGQIWVFDTVNGEAFALNGAFQTADNALLLALDVTPSPTILTDLTFTIKDDNAFSLIIANRP